MSEPECTEPTMPLPETSDSYRSPTESAAPSKRPDFTTRELLHELGNTLTSVEMLAVRIGAHFDAQEDASPLASEIKTATQHARDLTDRLRVALAGTSSAESEGDAVQPLDVNALLREMQPMLAAMAGNTCHLHLQLEKDLPGVMAAPADFRQLVQNLVANAIDALPDDGGKVVISTRVDDPQSFARREATAAVGDAGDQRYVCLEVADNGSGIPAEALRQVFDPGFTTKSSGQGDGLPVVRKIVEALRGAVTVNSHPPQGTTVHVLLPPANISRDEGTSDAGGAADERIIPVLVVDDHAAIRSGTKFLLESGDYGPFRVLCCAGGFEAASIIEKGTQKLEAVIIDMELLDCSGMDVLTWIRRVRPDVATVAVSGYREAELFAWDAERPHAFFPKPFDIEKLARKVRELVSANTSTV